MKCKMKSEERARKSDHFDNSTECHWEERKYTSIDSQNYLVLCISYFLIKKITTGITSAKPIHV